MPTSTSDIVQRLWNLCHVLRDDGITYHEYVTELTYLLFLKMTKEKREEARLPEGFRWSDLQKKTGVDQLTFYRKMLIELGTKGKGQVLDIFTNASTSLKVPHNLNTIIAAIDSLSWYDASADGFGDLYEGLLEKNASEKKSGAGQYFTPRPLIDAMVDLVKPQPGELIQDPAAGTAGFLIAADRYIKQQTHGLSTLSTRQQEFQIKEAFYGLELVQDTQRLALMNLLLHAIEAKLVRGDTLGTEG